MTIDILLQPSAIEHAVAVFARVSGLLLLAPVLSSRSIPKPTRMLLAVSLTVLMLGIAPATEARPGGLGMALLGELALGAAMGFAAELVFASMDLAAGALSFGAGLSYVNIVDPTSPVRGTVLMSLHWLLLTGLFLAIDGHHLMLRALATSFQVVPVGSVNTAALGPAVVAASGTLFSFGLALAAPALVVLMLIDLALGLVGRVAPHIHALIIGMGLKPLAAMISMSLVYEVLPRAIRGALDRTSGDIGAMMAAALG